MKDDERYMFGTDHTEPRHDFNCQLANVEFLTPMVRINKEVLSGIQQFDYFHSHHQSRSTEHDIYLCWISNIDPYSFRCHHWRYYKQYGHGVPRRVCSDCGWHFSDEHGWHPWDWRPE